MNKFNYTIRENSECGLFVEDNSKEKKFTTKYVLNEIINHLEIARY